MPRSRSPPPPTTRAPPSAGRARGRTGIEAPVRTEDAAVFGDRSNVYIGASRVVDSLFVYQVTVPPTDVDAARARLRDAGWGGHLGDHAGGSWSSREFVLALLAVFGVAAALIALAVLRSP